MYDIKMNGQMTSCGGKLGTVYLRSFPADANKIIRLREEMMQNGWISIPPVILSDGGDHHVALTGSHRLAAAQGIEDLEIEAVMLPANLSEEDWDLIDAANDDEDLLAAFQDVAGTRNDMDETVEVMAAEVEANAENGT